MMRRMWARLGRYPATAAVTTLTAAVGAAQLCGGGVVQSLQRDRPQVLAGQWWRLVTPMFVQPSGIGQYAFNLVGLVVAGVAVERLFRAPGWLAVFVGAGLAGEVFSYLAFPGQTGGGSSDGVAGLIGAVMIGWWVTHAEPGWPAYLYGAFFAAYLTGLAAGGVIVSTVAGGLSIALTATIRRRGPASLTRVTWCGLVVACGTTLTVLGDDHGVGLLAGAVVGLTLTIGSRRRAGESVAA